MKTIGIDFTSLITLSSKTTCNRIHIEGAIFGQTEKIQLPVIEAKATRLNILAHSFLTMSPIKKFENVSSN